jgi:hypothetical protein
MLSGAVGMAIGLLIVRHIVGLGPDAALVHDLLAFGSGPPPDSLSQAALDSGSDLLHYWTLAGATGAAVALVLGVLLQAGPAPHRRIGRTLTVAGLWLALAVSLAAVLPLKAYPLEQGDLAPVTTFAALALASATGLLLAAVSGQATATPLRSRQ